jgi:hypothetical protein
MSALSDELQKLVELYHGGLLTLEEWQHAKESALMKERRLATAAVPVAAPAAPVVTTTAAPAVVVKSDSAEGHRHRKHKRGRSRSRRRSSSSSSSSRSSSSGSRHRSKREGRRDNRSRDTKDKDSGRVAGGDGGRKVSVAASTPRVVTVATGLANIVCHHCGQLGHKRDQCPMLAPRQYAPLGGSRPYGQQGNPDAATGGHVTCHSCGQRGHKVDHCSLTVCRNCGKKGHVKANCPRNSQPIPRGPAERKCFHCGEGGHKKDSCPKLVRPNNNKGWRSGHVAGEGPALGAVEHAPASHGEAAPEFHEDAEQGGPVGSSAESGEMFP